MSDSFLLDWAALAVSLFNTILLLWLGLTVLLNAERRTRGTYLSALTLLAGSVFFLSHTVLLAYGLAMPTGALTFWWQMGWIPLVGIPLAWYAIVLWYSSYWQAGSSSSSRLRRTSFWLCALIALFILGALLLANPLPAVPQVAPRDFAASTWHGLPILALFFPLFALLCTGLSIEALSNPAPAQRMMGELARERSRPWLIAASLLLLLVSVLVAVFVGWLALVVYAQPFQPKILLTLVRFDLLIALLIALTVLFVGQAIVSYEIFTGGILPRRGLRDFWIMAILLAAIFSFTLSWGALYPLRPIYLALLSSALMTVFFVLLGWRTFVERNRAIASLRPFAASQRLYEQLIQPAETSLPGTDAHVPLDVLCSQVLDAKKALLVPVGFFANLVGHPIPFPREQSFKAPELDELIGQAGLTKSLCLHLPASIAPGWSWLVPLWNEGGMIGLILLDEKRGGSLYTQEEIEIARSVGERLIDTLASAEMSRRLMTLQRQHLAETQVADRRTRRSLHDEILPDLHTIILALSGSNPSNPQVAEAVKSLSQIHGKIADLLHNLPPAAEPELARSGIVGALQQSLENEFQGCFDQVDWKFTENAIKQSRDIPPTSREVLYYAAREAIRNSARHAHDQDLALPLKLILSISWEAGLKIVIEDNGIGVQLAPDTEGSTSLLSGNHGLALHSTLMAVIGGSLSLESNPGTFTRVTLFLPENIPLTHPLHDQ